LVIRNTANTLDLFRVKENGILNASTQMTFSVNNNNAMSIDSDLVLNIGNKLKTNKVETAQLSHYEETGGSYDYYTFGDDGLEYCGALLEARFNNGDLVFNIGKCITSFFSINAANAEPVHEFAARVATDAPYCNTGDTLLSSPSASSQRYYNCSGIVSYTNPYINYRLCRSYTATSTEVTKIEFSGTPGSNKLGLTTVKDNLVVGQNLWGDGVTSNCAWKNALAGGTWCPLGQYVAGFDPTGPRMYCCDL
jgi:hypothetical protein